MNKTHHFLAQIFIIIFIFIIPQDGFDGVWKLNLIFLKIVFQLKKTAVNERRKGFFLYDRSIYA